MKEIANRLYIAATVLYLVVELGDSLLRHIEGRLANAITQRLSSQLDRVEYDLHEREVAASLAAELAPKPARRRRRAKP